MTNKTSDVCVRARERFPHAQFHSGFVSNDMAKTYLISAIVLQCSYTRFKLKTFCAPSHTSKHLFDELATLHGHDCFADLKSTCPLNFAMATENMFEICFTSLCHGIRFR